MIYLLIINNVLMIIMFILNRNKYEIDTYNLDESFKFKGLLCIGLKYLDVLKPKLESRYMMWVYNSYFELYGENYARKLSNAHLAMKFVYFHLGISLFAIFSIIGNSDDGVTFLGSILSFLLFVSSDNDLKNSVLLRKKSIRIDFPKFLNKLILLVNAGMTSSKSWEKTALSGSDTPLYKEARKTLKDINSGKSETEAMEDFAKRCRMLEINKFVTIYTQNIKKGTYEMTRSLSNLNNEVERIKYNSIKQISEEASTKMIYPMILTLIGIIMVIISPVIYQFKNF